MQERNVRIAWGLKSIEKKKKTGRNGREIKYRKVNVWN